MKNQIFEVSFEELSELKLQETVGGGIVSWVKCCFKPSLELSLRPSPQSSQKPTYGGTRLGYLPTIPE